MINNDKKVLVIIPARGGSKGLPGKNIKLLCGIPLINYPIKTAKESKYVDKIIVSTDCKEISEIAISLNVKVHIREPQLATDEALISDAIRRLLKELDEKFDYIVLLEATSPIRDAAQVDKCIELIHEHSLDSVATFSELDPAPTRLWKIESNQITPLLENANPGLPRQKQSQAFYLNGIAYVFNANKFMASDSNIIFFGNKKAVVTTTPCIDIDTIDDFNIAEYLVRKKNENTI